MYVTKHLVCHFWFSYSYTKLMGP